MRFAIPIILFVSASASQQEATMFEVASVKPAGPRTTRMFSGGPGTGDPGRITWTRATLFDVLYRAYDLQDFEQISGPQWLSSEAYDITAPVPPGTTKKQFAIMLQGLLSSRFKMQVHHTTREFPVFFLVVAKGGPKLKEPGSETGMTVNFAGNTAHLTAHAQTVAALGRMLRSTAGRQILDHTGLAGKYDFTLEFAVREMAEATELPSIFDALPRQLGLRLEDAKAPFDVVVVDHAEKVPTEN